MILHRKGLRKESLGDGSVGLLNFWILILGPVLARALNGTLVRALNGTLAQALNGTLVLALVLVLTLDQALALASPLDQVLGLSQGVLTVKQQTGLPVR